MRAIDLYPLFTALKQVKRFWIAYSGGLDSTVLLHLAASQLSAKIPQELHVVHVNHGLSLQASQWEQHCENTCRTYQLPYVSIKVDAKPAKGESPEAAARQARYRAFSEIIGARDCLVTAHHEDDQIETLFLQLVRGAGPKGLAAMPPLKPFSQGYLFRPLLQHTRQDLKHYAVTHQLTWIDDESNFDIMYDRNYLRHHILPLMKQRWPGLNKTLTRASRLCAQAAELMDDLAKMDFSQAACLPRQTLKLSALRALSRNRRDNLLRYWLKQLGLPVPSEIKLQQIETTMLHARPDAAPEVRWPGAEVRRYRDELYAMPPLSAHDPETVIPWDLKSPLLLPANLGMLKMEGNCSPTVIPRPRISSGAGFDRGIHDEQCSLASKAYLDFGFRRNDERVVTMEDLRQAGLVLPLCRRASIRFRRGGEKIRLPGRAGTHDLKKLFQEWGIPPWLRDRVPLLYCDDELLWVVGYPFTQ